MKKLMNQNRQLKIVFNHGKLRVNVFKMILIFIKRMFKSKLNN